MQRTSLFAFHSPATPWSGNSKRHVACNGATHVWSRLDDVASVYILETIWCTQCSSIDHAHPFRRHSKTKLRLHKSKRQSAKLHPFARTHTCIFDIATYTQTANKQQQLKEEKQVVVWMYFYLRHFLWDVSGLFKKFTPGWWNFQKMKNWEIFFKSWNRRVVSFLRSKRPRLQPFMVKTTL